MAIFLALSLGLEPWLVAPIAIFALLPSLVMLGVVTARMRSEDTPSSEAARLGHHKLAPDRDSRP
jgi:hypothetical protein